MSLRAWVRSPGDLIWWEAFVSCRASSKAWALDFAVPRIADNPMVSCLQLPKSTDVAAIMALFPALLSPHVPLRLLHRPQGSNYRLSAQIYVSRPGCVQGSRCTHPSCAHLPQPSDSRRSSQVYIHLTSASPDLLLQGPPELGTVLRHWPLSQHPCPIRL